MLINKLPSSLCTQAMLFTISYPYFTSILRPSVGGGDDEDDESEGDGVDDGNGSEAGADGVEGDAPAPSADEPSRA